MEEFSKRLHYLEQILDVYEECQGYFEKKPDMIGQKILQSPYFYERARKFLYVHTCYDNFGRVTGQLGQLLNIIMALDMKMRMSV